MFGERSYVDQSDAEFVDVIQTDGESALKLGPGMMQPVSLYRVFSHDLNQVCWRYNK